MSNKSYWLRAGSYSLMQRGAVFVFGFGTYWLLVRYYPKEDFGVWGLFVLVSGIVEMSRSAFIQNAFVKLFNDPENDRSKLFWASLFLNLVTVLVFIAVIIGLIPVLSNFWNTDKIGALLLWYCLTSLVLVPFTQINYLEQANHSFRGQFWGSVVRQGFFFGSVLITYFFYPDMPMTFYASMQTVGAVAGLITAWFLSSQYIPQGLRFDWTMVNKLFQFGKYILGTGITSTVGKSTDQILLGSDHSVVANYNAAVRIMNFLEVPSLSISNIVYPKIAEKASKEGKGAAGIMYEKSVASILAIILPAVLLILVVPQFILLLTAGKQYMDVYPILRIITVAAIIMPFNIQLGSAFEVIGKPNVSFYINLGSNIFNVILNLILIRYYGAYGAACALLLTILSIFIVGQFLLRKEMKVSVTGVFVHLFDFYKRAFRMGMSKVFKK